MASLLLVSEQNLSENYMKFRIVDNHIDEDGAEEDDDEDVEDDDEDVEWNLRLAFVLGEHSK